jgi:hypothetical protein
LFVFLLIYGLSAAGVFLCAAILRRQLSLPVRISCVALPLIFIAPGLYSGRTIAPVDHALATAPWNTLPHSAPRNPYLNDIALQMAPWAKAVRLAWKQGSLPLLNRWNGCGMPLAANGQSAAFSLFTLLSMPLPLAEAFTLLAALKLLIALSGISLWLRELGRSNAASLLGAICFSFSLTMTPWLLFPHTAVLCFWPWMLLFLELLADPVVARRALWFLTAVFVAVALSGHPESAALAGLFCLLWLVVRSLSGTLPAARRVLGLATLASALALGLSAFLLLPEIFAIGASNRWATSHAFWQVTFSWIPHRPVWPEGLLVSLFPRTLGDGINSPMLPGSAGAFPEMSLAYFGIVGWATALLIWRRGSPRPRVEWCLIPLMIFGFGAAIALWPFGEIAGHLPVVKLMFPLRFLSWATLSGAALAAFEYDRLGEDLREKRSSALTSLLVPALLAAAGVVVFSRYRQAHASLNGLGSQREALVLVLVVLAGYECVVLLAVFRISVGRWSALVLLVPLCCLELIYQGERLYSFGPASSLFPELPLFRFLAREPGMWRAVGEGVVMFPNSNVFAGVEEVGTHDPIERHDFMEFLSATCGYDPDQYFKQIHDINSPALDFLNVAYLVAGPGRSAPAPKWKPIYQGSDGTVFENRDVLPRVFAPPRVRRMSWPASRLAVAKDVFRAFGMTAESVAAGRRWATDALVSIDEPGASFEPEDEGNDRVVVEHLRETTNTVSFHVSPSRPGHERSVLVTSLTTDGGWEARDERGKLLPTGIANGPFLAVLVPAGEHDVRLTYRPPGFRAGVVISMFTVVALAGVSLVRHRRR